MRILILTQYYPPETGAPQNRLSSLARHLQLLGADVAILTAMPNYPSMKILASYQGKWYVKDQVDGITVHRSWIYARKTSGVFKRLVNYFSFVFSSTIVGLFKVKKHDVIICESPPLFLGIAALIISRFKGSKLVVNISDLWPESAEKLGIVTNKFFLSLAYQLEARLYKRSVLVSGQTQGIVNSIKGRFPKVKTFWLPNGIDSERYNVVAVDKHWREKNGFQQSDFLVLYAGILGHAQALEVILKAAKIVEHDKAIKFIMVGDGPEKDKLHSMQKELNLQNMFFLGNILSHKMPAIIYTCNTAIVPLKNIPLFHGAIPSKLFENLAFAKPILLGVDGEAKELFIEKGKAGLFFTPEDEAELAAGILKLKNDPVRYHELGNNGRKYVKKNFDRADIAASFYNKLKEAIA